ncbi:MAG: c-type cytochrome [Proteobacteria bacterium]|nr:c-type cytochrome [Pseudomonadota bacterium]
MKKYFAAWALLLSINAFFIVSMSAHANESIHRKANCSICHSVEIPRIGPAYKDIAARYRGDDDAPKKLFDKVRKGGAGNWGEVPMVPYPIDAISDDDLKTVIHWILFRK